MQYEIEEYIVSETPEGLVAGHPVLERTPVFVGPSISSEYNALNLGFESIACVKLNDPGFEFDSSFVKPDVEDEIAKLFQLREELKRDGRLPPVSIFGHADPIGDDNYNKQLSGRRAQAIYALLVRDAALWEDLYSHPFMADQWGVRSIQTMLEAAGHSPGIIDGVAGEWTKAATKSFQIEQNLTVDGEAGPATRRALFLAYMSSICGSGNKLNKSSDFLAHGDDPQGKGDYQGCSEFNPLMLFSQSEHQELSQPGNKSLRDEQNQPNRRVLIFLFRPGDCVNPAVWPCPRAKEGVAGCEKRFYLDAAKRRGYQEKRRYHAETRDTFACRFYQLRIAERSPCERIQENTEEDPLPRGDAEENDQVNIEEFLPDGKTEQTDAPGMEKFDFAGDQSDTGTSSSSSFAKSAPGDKKSFGKSSAPPVIPAHTNSSPAKDPKLASLIAQLIAGDFAAKGEFDAAKGEFLDPELNQLLQAYAAFWHDALGQPVDTTDATEAGTKQKLPKSASAGGDSFGKEVNDVPLWVNIFQNRLITAPQKEFKTTFRDDHRATQRLLQAFFNADTIARTGSLHPSLEEFFFHVGKTEYNGQAGVLGGREGATDWCQTASSAALIRGLLRHGLRFAPGPFVTDSTTDYNQTIGSQIGRFEKWLKKPGNVTRVNSSAPPPLTPGDQITVVNGGPLGPLSGHVATVIEERLGATTSKETGIGVILYVSGNAAGSDHGDGSIRVEEVDRESLPDSYNYATVADYSNKYAAQKEVQSKAAKEIVKLNEIYLKIAVQDDPERALEYQLTYLKMIEAEEAKIAKAEKEKARIKSEANSKGLPVDREDSVFKANPGKFAPVANDSSWVVKIFHTSRLGTQADGGDLTKGTSLDQLKGRPADFE